ncbi:30S ribosomal protein S17 [Trichinella spiralis]|uniref:Uncharacterized protein n=3 Tax=Trichinella spiralis TaxID=6334 RepID=E5SMK6_TRISP|nr:30S ribosomal protein S17 [Trichinella spiralis]KRY29737.1 hypothetical protein T01_13959 [Trichinella spiralis]KRY34423.1 hypothetical protein T01_8202 [Trichinella spiralis]
MKSIMGMCNYSKLILALHVLCYVTKTIAQMYDDQAIKEMQNLIRISNGRYRGEFREKPNEYDELFKENWSDKIARASTIMVLLGCVLYSALILIFRFNIPKKYRKYVKKLKNINRYFHSLHDGRRIKRIPCKMRPRMKRRRKLQLA